MYVSNRIRMQHLNLRQHKNIPSLFMMSVTTPSASADHTLGFWIQLEKCGTLQETDSRSDCFHCMAMKHAQEVLNSVYLFIYVLLRIMLACAWASTSVPPLLVLERMRSGTVNLLAYTRDCSDRPQSLCHKCAFQGTITGSWRKHFFASKC